jgi:hypothetical protein
VLWDVSSLASLGRWEQPSVCGTLMAGIRPVRLPGFDGSPPPHIVSGSPDAMTTTFTANLPPGVELPKEKWLPATVRRHGALLEISAGEPVASGSESREQALEAWLARSAARPPVELTDETCEDLRWEELKAKYRL